MRSQVMARNLGNRVTDSESQEFLRWDSRVRVVKSEIDALILLPLPSNAPKFSFWYGFLQELNFN